MKKYFFLFLLFLAKTAAAQINTDSSSPPTFSTWGAYSYFYLNDKRENGSGATRGQNAVYSANYSLTPAMNLGAYGIYQRSETDGPRTIISSIPQQNFTYAEGWGGGLNLAYQISRCFKAYGDFSYVWIRQNQVQSSESTFPPTVSYRSSDGRRWQASGGILSFFPLYCFYFAGNVNYLYISSQVAGSVDTLTVELTGQNSRIGIGSANGTLYLRPKGKVIPFINGGFSYDLHRQSSGGTPVIVTSTPLPAPSTNRFEWNGGAGVLLIKNSFSFATSYLHKRRAGPVTVDMVTFYANKSF